MRGPDVDRERSERALSINEFLTSYNEGLPPEYPRASMATLNIFAKTYPDLFKKQVTWSLDVHRKRVMDWLPSHLRYAEEK